MEANLSLAEIALKKLKILVEVLQITRIMYNVYLIIYKSEIFINYENYINYVNYAYIMYYNVYNEHIFQTQK